ncbi:MAG: acyltransferase [Prevotellaceae bacterium]|nr:acyltransferase [Prevotellaceae bacterium]
MSQISNSRERMQWVDAMRGFSMIIVVLAHVLANMDIGGYKSFLSFSFLTFRMPLFFFVSGFFSYRTIEWWNKSRVIDILKRKVQAQIFCTIIFLSIFQLVTTGSFQNILKTGFGGYWFTIVLFQMYICYLIFSLISRLINCNITFVALVLLSIAGVVIVAFYKGGGNLTLWNLLYWENLTKYFQFFTLGIFVSRYRELFFSLMQNTVFSTLMIVGWVGCLLLCYNDFFKTAYPFLFRVVHDIVVRYCSLMAVIMIFFGKAQYMSASKVGKHLQFIGRRTLDIYMIHFFLIPNLRFLGPFLSKGNMFVIQLSISAVVTLIIVAISLLVSYIIRRSDILAQWLFGVKIKKAQP